MGMYIYIFIWKVILMRNSYSKEHIFQGIAVIHGEQKESDSDLVDGRNSPPAVPRSRTMEVSLDTMPGLTLS